MIEHKLFNPSHCNRLLKVNYYTCREAKELLDLNEYNFNPSDKHGDHLYKVQSQMVNVVAMKQKKKILSCGLGNQTTLHYHS